MRPQRLDLGRLPRRQALGLLVGTGATALLAACGGSGGAGVAEQSSTAAATSAAISAAPTSAAATSPAAAAKSVAGSKAASAASSAQPSAALPVTAKDIKIIDTGAKLPAGATTFGWLQSGPGPKGTFLEQFFQAYQSAHPNITVQFQQLPWANINTVVPLGIQNGNAPDIFQLPQSVTGAQAVAQGWVTPLDDIIPNIAEWKKAFPSGAFVEGITLFGGKIYTLPLSSTKLYGTLLLYNLDYLQQAGYDPASQPFTWDQFRQAARKLTAQGKGAYSGLILEGKDTNRFSAWVTSLAQMAGAAGGEMNWKSGQYNFTTDQFQAAIELLLAIKADGSIYAGSLALNAEQARALVPQGKSAMILQGPWNIQQWQLNSRRFKFGVASQPLPNSGTPLPLTYGPGGGNHYWLYARSKLGAVAGDIFYQLGTLPIQKQFATVDGLADPAILPGALASATLDALQHKAASLFDQQMRLAPSPQVRNPDVAKVELEMHHVTPDPGQTIQGLYTGQLSNPKQAMKDLQDRMEAELDRAIKAAQAKGAKVSRDDWKFPNWDPTKDYTAADYQALKGS